MSKFLLIALFLISTSLGAYYLVPKHFENQALRSQLDEAQQQILDQRAKIDKTRNHIDNLHRNRAAIEKIARDKFGLCREGERVYKFTDEDKLRSAIEK